MTDRGINKTACRSALHFYLFYSSLFTSFTFLYLSLTFILTTVAARWQLCSPVPVCNRGCSCPLSPPTLSSPLHCIASTTRSRRDNFTGSNLSFTCLQRSHRDYFSGLPSGHLNKNWTLTDPYREARTAVSERSGPAQTLPRAALPDVRLDVGAELPEAAATSRIPRAERPPVVLEIPGSIPEPSEPRRHKDLPSKGPRPPR